MKIGHTLWNNKFKLFSNYSSKNSSLWNCFLIEYIIFLIEYWKNDESSKRNETKIKRVKTFCFETLNPN